MKTDTDLERQLRRILRETLDAELGPDPMWAESPAARRVAVADRRRRHRWPLRALAVAALVGAGGGAALLGGSPDQAPDVLPPLLFPDVRHVARSDMCPGGTQLADIRDTSAAGNDAPHWAARARPETGEADTAEIAIGLRVPGGPTEVRLLDPASDSSCLLVELPEGLEVSGMSWSPAGDALAVAAESASLESGAAGQPAGLYVWSSFGTRLVSREPWIGGTRYSAPTWAEDGTLLAFGNPGTIAADGSEPVPYRCVPPGQSVECPAFPRILISPDMAHLAMSGGDRYTMVSFGLASTREHVFRPIELRSESGDVIGIDLMGWLDAHTLLGYGNDELLAIPIERPSEYWTWSTRTAEAISPDRQWTVNGGFGEPLVVHHVETGVERVVFDPSQLGEDIHSWRVEWSPDSRSLLFQVEGRTDGGEPVELIGLWVVNVDGSGLRPVVDGPVTTAGTDELTTIGAWRPDWGSE